MTTLSSFQTSDFQSHQIIRLQHKNTYVYAEVIQVIADRQLCWARPLVLLTQKSPESDIQAPDTFIDLREGADLLLPLSWFQAAIDVEVIPILAQLDIPKPDPELNPALPHSGSAHRRLQQFIQQLCHARSEAP